MALKLSIGAPVGERITIKVAGVMDAEMDLNRIEQVLREGARVILDLGDVDRINSGGVREWMRFVGSVDRRLELVCCPPSFIDQINYIYGFLGSAVVRSVQVPFCCGSCDATKTVVVEAALVATRDPDPATCDDCGAEMECDVVPESYFGFLRPG